MNDTRRAVLDALADGPVTGPALAKSLNISRAAVWKHIEALRDGGFAIDGGPDGYSLEGVPDYGDAALEFELEAPFSIEYHESIASTNDRARELASSGADGVVVVADEQVGGRGRLEREWAAPSGGIWASVVRRPAIPPARATLYTLAAAVATARTAREAGVDARIKWPNDVVVPAGENGDYRKLAGILTEMEGQTDRVEWLVVGIGVNANIDASALPDGATTLRDERSAAGAGGDRADGSADGDVDRRAFVQRLLEAFHEYERDLDAVVPAWTDLALTIGQRVRVELPDGDVVGDAVRITDRGALVLETGDDRVTVSAGDCEHLRPA